MTDIMDKDLKDARNARWKRAFSQDSDVSSEEATESRPEDLIHRKATIVLEHLLQASDIAHTMQHWHIYRMWNERFFAEQYLAYRRGRLAADPSIGWYNGEMGFFDFYIIPLAKKLKDCGVFGVSSDEYLNYAQKNRWEWELKGEDIVAGMLEKYELEYADISPSEEYYEKKAISLQDVLRVHADEDMPPRPSHRASF